MHEKPIQRDPEHGGALIVSLITLVALLGIGGVTILAVQSELASAGHARFGQSALYAAESGVAAAMDFLRTRCDPTRLFTDTVNNQSSWSGIYGNGKRYGQTGYPFSSDTQCWYEVDILNNESDPQYGSGVDSDGIVVVQVVGHGPNQSVSTLSVEVFNNSCQAASSTSTRCDADYSQRGVNSMNSSNANCSSAVGGGTPRSVAF
ncbi:MAG: pilus assembly PilX N-terminal domain-containing protein [Deltaproteobacteria bacterium]|nr:pilus assembly PilX N-terminal domain-containing protein [Deltaproteobacteria bacterium]